MKAIVLILLAAIVASLGSGLFFLAKDNNSTRVLSALKLRVALSIVLILFLVVSFWLGWIAP